MGKHKITLKELYDLVWSTPMTTLSKKYLISTTVLRKICVQNKIPLPKAGHWEKLRAGKNVEIENLLESDFDREVIELIERSGEQLRLGKLSSEVDVLEHEILNDKRLNLQVPEKLSNPLKLIEETKKILSNKDNLLTGGFVSTWRCPLKIHVTKANVDRALRIMDTFIKAVEKRGHHFHTSDDSNKLVIHGEEFSIKFREKTKRVLKPSNSSWQEYDYIATDILAIVIRIRWQDTEYKDGKLPLERQLSKIIAKLEIRGEEERKKTLVRQKQREVREEEARIKKEQELRIQKELNKFEQLKDDAVRWHEASLIRSYILELEQKALSNHKMTEKLSNWINWARKKADWHDPTVDAQDGLLGKIEILQ